MLLVGDEEAVLVAVLAHVLAGRAWLLSSFVYVGCDNDDSVLSESVLAVPRAMRVSAALPASGCIWQSKPHLRRMS